MARETFVVESRRLRRKERIGVVQHVLGAILLITSGYAHVTTPGAHGRVIPYLEIAAGAALIATAIVERVRRTHARVAWLEIAGGVMMFVEAIAKLEEPHHLSFRILSFAPPIVLLAFGIFDERLRNAHRLMADDEHFEVRTRALFPRRVRWNGLRTYRINSSHIEFAGEQAHKLSIRDIENRDEALAWAEAQFARRGLTKEEE